MARTTIGIIGGTGLYAIDGLENIEHKSVDTPFGSPTSTILSGTLGEAQLLFIARHGEGHVFLPSEVNYRANIFALKTLGAHWCIGVNAVGSLKEEYRPGDVVVPDQIIDRTRHRSDTFFGSGICAHVPFATPFCPVLASQLVETSEKCVEGKDIQVHKSGTYLCMEGPAFSTRAESQLYRSWGASIIGMTAIPEAKLAREAEIAYAQIAMVTDYDCWRSEDADVAVDDIMALMAKNADVAKNVVSSVVQPLTGLSPSELAADALKQALITDPAKMPEQQKKELQPLLGKYVS